MINVFSSSLLWRLFECVPSRHQKWVVRRNHMADNLHGLDISHISYCMVLVSLVVGTQVKRTSVMNMLWFSVWRRSLYQLPQTPRDIHLLPRSSRSISLAYCTPPPLQKSHKSWFSSIYDWGPRHHTSSPHPSSIFFASHTPSFSCLSRDHSVLHEERSMLVMGGEETRSLHRDASRLFRHKQLGLTQRYRASSCMCVEKIWHCLCKGMCKLQIAYSHRGHSGERRLWAWHMSLWHPRPTHRRRLQLS